MDSKIVYHNARNQPITELQATKDIINNSINLIKVAIENIEKNYKKLKTYYEQKGGKHK